MENEIKLNKQLLETYQENINQYEETKEQLRLKTLEFEEQNKQLIESIEISKESVNKSKEIIKELAETEFNKNPDNKKLLGGLSIRIGLILDYDENEAFKYAENHKLFLKLDTKSFDKYAKDNPLDFVKKEEKITVCFPKEFKFEGD